MKIIDANTHCKRLAVSLIGLCALLTSLNAQAWWNGEWSSRRQINLDASATGADIQGSLADFPLLIRLHAGNFGYFAELAENGADIRFLKDDKTPLAFQIEHIDAINEIGFVWVKQTQVQGGTDTNSFWMYYGNANAADASDGKSLYDVAQGLVYHFKDGEIVPQDATAYASHAASSDAQVTPGGWIGAALQFNNGAGVIVNPAPQLALAPDKGWTFSAWLRVEQAQSAAQILRAGDGAHTLSLTLQGLNLQASWDGEQTAPVALTPGAWRHVALTAAADRLTLYLDGAPVGQTAIHLTSANPKIEIGANFAGLLDEVQIASAARGPDWLKLAYRSQSPDFAVLNFGEDETNASSDSHFMVIVHNVTIDGWVIIGLTGIMLVIAVLVMVTKTIVINRIVKDNKLFLARYRELDHSHLGDLDQEEDAEERELSDSEFLTALVGRHDHFQSSTLYHLYHTAIHEMKQLQGGVDSPITAEAWNYLHVKLDSQIVLESQRLNKNMVLLTIAIAGGPFLGLLGTVVGVMITFAAIAATGDVNINSIAPGIAAALLATVAGLAVAIPALFSYNYLLTQIKDITAGMRVFSDEFLALLSMRTAAKYINGNGKRD